MFYGPSLLEVMVQRLTAQAANIAGIVGSSVHDEELVGRAFQAKAAAHSQAPEDSLLRLTDHFAPFGAAPSNTSFTAPICDLILTVFELDSQSNWLRRQATTLILQQVLGGTIER